MMLRCPVWLLLLLVASCSSTPPTSWLPEPLGEPVTWRQLRLYRGQDAFVLASREHEASEAHRLFARMRAAATETVGVSPPPGLVIVIGETDEPLFDEVEDYKQALRRWGAATNVRFDPSRNSSGQGNQPKVDPSLGLRLVAAAAPIDDADLNLPAVLREQFTHAMITPSDACVEAVCATLIEASFDANDIGWAKRQLIYAVVDPGAMMAEKITPQIRAAFVDGWTTVAGLSQAQRKAVREEFGLPVRDDNGSVVIAGEEHGLLPPKQARLQLSMEGLELDTDLQLGVSSTPKRHQLFAMRSLGWSLIVDLNLLRSKDAHVLRGEPHYEWLPSKQFLPDRRDAEAFEAMRLKHPGFALVFERDANRAAALLASHAFWVRGLDADAAIKVGLRFGLDPRLESGVRKPFVR